MKEKIYLEKYEEKIYFYINKFLLNEKKYISPWNDINLIETKETYYFIVEIPTGKLEKKEISLKEENNPIILDTINEKARQRLNDKIINEFIYGAFPQTYSSKQRDLWTNYPGDEDPLDGILIFNDEKYKNIETGTILSVKILGAIPIIDDEKSDWKILVYPKDEEINIDENLEKINKIINYFINFSQMEKKNVFVLNKTKLLKDYIISPSKEELTFCIANKKLAKKIIKQDHISWLKLDDKKRKSLK